MIILAIAAAAAALIGGGSWLGLRVVEKRNKETKVAKDRLLEEHPEINQCYSLPAEGEPLPRGTPWEQVRVPAFGSATLAFCYLGYPALGVVAVAFDALWYASLRLEAERPVMLNRTRCKYYFTCNKAFESKWKWLSMHAVALAKWDPDRVSVNPANGFYTNVPQCHAIAAEIEVLKLPSNPIDTVMVRAIQDLLYEIPILYKLALCIAVFLWSKGHILPRGGGEVEWRRSGKVYR